MFLHDIHKKKNILNPVLKNSHIEKLYIFAPAFGKRSEETINIQYNIFTKNMNHSYKKSLFPPCWERCF